MTDEDTNETLMKTKITGVSGKALPTLGQSHGSIDNQYFCLPFFSYHLVIEYGKHILDRPHAPLKNRRFDTVLFAHAFFI